MDKGEVSVDGLGRDCGWRASVWIPAYAGMTCCGQHLRTGIFQTPDQVQNVGCGGWDR